MTEEHTSQDSSSRIYVQPNPVNHVEPALVARYTPLRAKSPREAFLHDSFPLVLRDPWCSKGFLLTSTVDNEFAPRYLRLTYIFSLHPNFLVLLMICSFDCFLVM